MAVLSLVALDFLVMLLWMTLTYGSLEALRTGRSRGPISELQPILCGCVALVYFTAAMFPLFPVSPASLSSNIVYLYLANDILGFAAVALFHHLSWYFQRGVTGPPSKTWLALNYSALVALSIFCTFVPVPEVSENTSALSAYHVASWGYLFVMLASSVRRVAWRARSTGWRAGAFGLASRPDLIVLWIGLGLLIVVIAIILLGDMFALQYGLGWTMALFGLVVGIPFAVRNLGATLRDSLVTLASVGVMLAWIGASWVLAQSSPPSARGPLLLLLVATGLAAAFFFLQPGLWRSLDRALFGRRHDQQATLQRSLHELSPELGVQTCTERALAALVRTLQLEGAALLLRDGGVVVEGRFQPNELARLWPRGDEAEALLSRTLIGGELGELPSELADARVEAGVVAVVAVRGSSRLWGHLLLTTDLVGASLHEQDLRAIEAFADQVGLLLDGAELLARTVSVERTLAHAEKLAVIGELTARVAHEIRNPATAAKSLAQQLVREGGPNQEELRIILGELDRIERQVADLLQFGRRDEVELSSIDFGALARATAQDLRPSLRASGIELDVVAEAEARGPGDPERLRQVLINLVENARDAVTESKVGRHVSIAVRRGAGRVALEVSDDGPGVDEDTLNRLFEPFFSRKHEGTGLGLAIARRTIEAHGGQIHARRRPAGGMRFLIDLPGVRPADPIPLEEIS